MFSFFPDGPFKPRELLGIASAKRARTRPRGGRSPVHCPTPSALESRWRRHRPQAAKATTNHPRYVKRSSRNIRKSNVWVKYGVPHVKKPPKLLVMNTSMTWMTWMVAWKETHHFPLCLIFEALEALSQNCHVFSSFRRDSRRF